MPVRKAYKASLWMLFVLYLAALLKVVLFKRPLGYIKDHFLHQYSYRSVELNLKQANFIPFHTIELYLNTRLRAEYSVENVVGNVMIFIPLGILTPLLFRSCTSVWKVFFVSLLTSLFLETVQLVTVLGVFDVDDLLLNTTGGLIGYLLFKLSGIEAFSRRQIGNVS